MKKLVFIMISSLLLHTKAAVSASGSDSIALNGQLIGWAGISSGNPGLQEFGGRFLPEVFCQHSFHNAVKIDMDLSANAYSSLEYDDWKYTGDQSRIKPYRASLRLSSRQWEVRAGLQKLSFGSASLLRPLMWFDGMDPRDPLQLTDGIYGLLGRYYFLDNANLWVWGLIGNKDPRGWDYVPTQIHKPEFGGRFQFPFLHGEMGVTVNHRLPGSNSAAIYGIPSGTPIQYTEDKAGLDGKWDIGPGIWFEYVLKHNSLAPIEIPELEHYLTLGSDYTFAWGNGLNLLAEHFVYASYNPPTGNNQSRNFTAASLSYPFGLRDRISAMIYRGWEDKSWYRFVNYQRQYDNLSLYLMLFRNPDSFRLYPARQDSGLFTGKGFEIMASYNF